MQSRSLIVNALEFFNSCCPGVPSLEFKKAMRAEHTTRGGSTYTFISGNYSITTQPCHEWSYVVGDENGRRVDFPGKSNDVTGRDIKPIDELMQKPLALKAKLTEEEVIAVVLYTGSLQHHCLFLLVNL